MVVLAVSSNQGGIALEMAKILASRFAVMDSFKEMKYVMIKRFKSFQGV